MDNTDKIFKRELDNYELGNSEDLWRKFEAKKEEKKYFGFKSQIIAVAVIIIIALPYSIKDSMFSDKKENVNDFIDYPVTLQEIKLDIETFEEESEQFNVEADLVEMEKKIPQSVLQIEERNIKEINIDELKAAINLKPLTTTKQIKLEQPKRFSLGIQTNPNELLAMAEEDNQKGPAELLASKLLNSISEKSKNFITYTKIE